MYSYKTLQAMARKAGLSSTGKGAEILERLQAWAEKEGVELDGLAADVEASEKAPEPQPEAVAPKKAPAPKGPPLMPANKPIELKGPGTKVHEVGPGPWYKLRVRETSFVGGGVDVIGNQVVTITKDQAKNPLVANALRHRALIPCTKDGKPLKG